MKRFHAITAVTALCLSTPALTAADGNDLDPDAWPRTYKVGGAEVAIYMPQILEWSEFRHLKANAAIGVKLEGQAEASFGAAAFEADTVTDFDRGSVSVGKRTIAGFRFPEMDAATAAKAEALVRSVLTPESAMELPLYAVTAAVDRADASTDDTPVSFEPPPIFFSDSPAVMVVFIGEPKLEPVKGDDPSLMFATNTNWDLLMAGTDYYLLAGNQWLVTKDLAKGPWTAAATVPDSFKQLPDDGNWSEVKSKLFVLPGAATTPKVFVSSRPSEIILTEGKPQLAPISGTSLMYVANTQSDLFLDTADKTYYLLTAGRWFGAASLDGPWTAATGKLPEDFASIPADHPKADVLVSVKGTPEADEAVILASIPQTATVTRANTTIQVAYEGEPKFKPVPGTEGIEFAINTDSDVFLVAKLYYCCEKGVWFQAPAATGAWAVCDKVPAPIYTIPPESPKYNVTHVHVYESSPDTVQVGTTSGYSGAYVANGLVVFGLGMWLGHELADNDDYWHGHYYPKPYWYGYGCGAAYHPGSGYYRKGAHCYGPYGGAGYGAAYNPATGAYARGAYAYGPNGAVGAKAAYNPWTNTAAGRVGASTPYGSWGRSAVVRDDEWIRGGHRSNAKGTVAGIETSRGGAAVGVDRKYGSDGFAGKTAGGDVYVGKDGNIYKKDADGGGWQKRGDGGWQGAPDVPAAKPYATGNNSKSKGDATATRPNPPTARPADKPEGVARPTQPEKQPVRKPDAAPRPAQPTTRPGNKGGGYTNRQATPSQLNRDSYSRERSTRQAPAARQSRGGGGGGGGGRERR
ncbi:hypothetical protein [Luteolibacter sp. Populi]|uniref:hypothetical protein n=1 Tax=Luteolibacter sp. Populi TaxID=3230487 RepID=UPI003466A4CD